MTKKSQGRLARDEMQKQHKAGSTCWSDLENIYTACNNAVVNAKQKIHDLYSEKYVRPFLENHKEIAVNLRGITDDGNRLLESLNSIRAKHIDKKGGAEVDSQELIESLQLSSEYEQWQSQLELAFLPTVEYLISEFSAAHNRYLTALKAQEENQAQAQAKQTPQNT